MKFSSIAFRIFAYVIPAVVLYTAVFLYMLYNVTNIHVDGKINEKMFENLKVAVHEIRSELMQNAKISLSLAIYAETCSIDTINRGEMKEFITKTILSNKNTIGCGILFEPYAVYTDKRYFGPYVHIKNGEAVYEAEYAAAVDYHTEAWYLSGKQSDGALVWSAVYHDPVPNVTMITAAAPFYDSQRRLRGIANADMALTDIQAIVKNISVGETGKAFILGAQGEYISFIDDSRGVRNTIQDDADVNLAAFGKHALATGEGMAHLERSGILYRAYYKKMPETHWTLVTVIESVEIASSIVNEVVLLGLVPVAGLLLVTASIISVARHLRSVAESVTSFAASGAAGDFSKRIEVTGHDEFSRMQAHLNTMMENGSRMHARQIDELRKDSARLEEMAYWYESILDAIPLPVSVQDSEMRWQFVNVALEKLLERQRREIIGLDCNTWGISICNTDRCAIFCAKRGLKQTRVVHEGLSYQFDVAPLKNLHGETTGFIEIIQDITRMELLAKERADAETANRAKSAFLARMSHEIRTPMNAILGITEMQMQDVRMPYHMMDAFGRIYTAGYTLLGIINDLLDLSKIESGRMELLSAKYEIASLISDAVQLNLGRIGSKMIAFTLEVDKDMPAELFGDELRIRQILNNLLSNAFKYTVEGEVVLSVSAENGGVDERRDVTLVCRVRDTGPGMTAEQLERLFDEYARFDLEANRMIEGIGLGMSITRQLVYMMNGEIFVESEPGRGSTFTVRLPQGRIGVGSLGWELVESLRQFKVDMSHMKAPQIVRDPMPYGSVLIVDDLETNLYVAKGLMMPYGMLVDTALSGFEVLDKIRSGKEYDIVFMDHMMPQMDGVETVKHLRDLGYTRSIVALTANAVVGQTEIFLQSGFDDFLSKPIDLRQLNALLNRLIRDRQAPEVLEAARQQQRDVSAFYGTPQLYVDSQLAKIFIRDAEKSCTVLEGIHRHQYRRDDDLHMYVITVHAMKSALANIGETQLAALAYRLEQAGRNGETAVVIADTPSFLSALRAIIEKHTPKEEDACSMTADEDPTYLREQLSIVQAACATYDKKAAKDALAALRQKTWSRQTGERLDAVAGHLLHSEFEEAAECCGRVLSG